MAAPLPILAVTLPVPELAAADKFYRWVLAMKTSEEAVPEGTTALGWGREDRIVLVDAEALGAEEAITLRLPAMTVEAAARWLVERDLTPERAVVPPADEPVASTAWPDAAIETATDPATHNRLLLMIRGPVEPRIDLHVALPAAVVAGRGSIGPFHWRSEDRSDLEIPGLLGVTTGAPDIPQARDFLASLGIEPIEGEQGPLGVGDHQWIVEEKEPAGIYGIAVVLQAARIMDLVRTLERLEARYRHATPLVPATNGSQMLIKRSVSPDGKIDVLSVEFSCPVGLEESVATQAARILALQDQIAGRFLKAKNGEPHESSAADVPRDDAVKATILDVGSGETHHGRKLFLRFQAEGRTLRRYGSWKQLAGVLEQAGYREEADNVSEGTRLNLPCRVVLRHTEDGRCLNVVKVLPAQASSARRAR